MALSRPYLIALAGAVVLMGVFLGIRVAGGGSDDGSAPAASGEPTAAQSVGRAETVEPDAGPSGSATRSGTPAQAPAARPASEDRAADVDAVPARVQRALDARRVVVLFFSQRAADDLATREAVRSLRGRRGVAVFTDDVEDLAAYAGVVAGLDITRAPAVVVVDRAGEATVEQGFLDAGSLDQRVRDARR